MEEFLKDMSVAAPAAAATIFCVVLFLRHLREERKSRDETQSKFLVTMEKLSAPITELTIEVRLLREQHSRAS